MMRNKSLLLAVISSLVAVFVTMVLLLPHSPLPKSVASQVHFTTFVPAKPYDVPRDHVTYNKSQGVLTIKATGPVTMTITEQGTPDAFNDSPQVYPALLDKMHEYKELDTGIGKVALTKPQELGGAVAAVIHTSGTLMFIRPSRDLSDAEWKDFINNMQVIK